MAPFSFPQPLVLSRDSPHPSAELSGNFLPTLAFNTLRNPPLNQRFMKSPTVTMSMQRVREGRGYFFAGSDISARANNPRGSSQHLQPLCFRTGSLPYCNVLSVLPARRSDAGCCIKCLQPPAFGAGSTFQPHRFKEQNPFIQPPALQREAGVSQAAGDASRSFPAVSSPSSSPPWEEGKLLPGPRRGDAPIFNWIQTARSHGHRSESRLAPHTARSPSHTDWLSCPPPVLRVPQNFSAACPN